jgi:hypothetical protein
MSISQFSNYAELAMLNWMLTSTPMSGANARPVAWFLGLSLTTPTTSAGGIIEPAGSGYSRQSITFSSSTGNPAQCTNSNALVFAASGGDWGTVVYSILYDALTVGHVWAMGPLQTPTVIQTGNNLTFQSGSLAVNLT